MTVKEESLLPSSAASTSTRIRTFQSSSGESYWPHKPKKSWKPSVENVAAAGFVFAETPDFVMCPYCQYTIGAWEASDDPMEIHQTKKPNCPFFTITLESQPVKPTGKAAPKPRATRAKRTTTATVAASQAGSVMGQEDEVVESSEPAKMGRKAKATTAKVKGKKVAESEIAESVVEEDEEEMQSVVLKEVEKPKRRGGGRAKKIEAEPIETEMETQTLEEVKEVPEPKKKERKPRATKASKKAEAEAAEALSKAGAEAEVEAEPLVEREAMDLVEDKAPISKSTKSTSSRATKSTKSNPTTSSTPASVPVPIPETMPAPAVPSKSSRPIKSIRAAKLDKSTKPATSAIQSPPESVPIPSSSSSQQPPSSKPPSSKSKSTSTTSKPLPPTPKTSFPAPSQPLNQLTHFANVPPTSPMVPEDPMREDLNTDLGEMAKSARGVVVPGEGEEWMKEPLTAAEKKMTIEQLINRQMGRRALIIEEEGEEMIRKWKEGAVAIRSQIQAALR